MKSVMISIQPKWCEKIAAGEKTDEIRKNSPKIETPFKCYIYQTRMIWSYPILRVLGLLFLVDKLEIGKGKVIGEFVCDKIEQIDVDNGKRIAKTSGVSLQAMWKYAEPKSMFDLKAWHISDLRIYDEPKPLSEFRRPCDNDLYCEECGMYSENRNRCGNGALQLTRPPQSWCYVEELQDGK